MELKLPPPKQRLKQENERASRELLKEEKTGKEEREEKRKEKGTPPTRYWEGAGRGCRKWSPPPSQPSLLSRG